MTIEELKKRMTALVIAVEKNPNDLKKVIAQAVTLGMTYQEELIKAGIDTVFEQLHKK